jgi:crooked neck
MIGDIPATRTVFERWMYYLPNEQAWLTYIKFEERQGKWDNARNLYERMIVQIPEESVPPYFVLLII